MTSLQRSFLALALVALAAAAWYRYSVMSANAPAPLEPVDIVFVTGGSGAYWQLTANGARKAADDLEANVDIEMPSDAESLSEQTEILEHIRDASPGGIAVSPLDAAQQTELINALAKGSYVVTFDSDAPDSKRTGYVGTSNFAAVRVCARPRLPSDSSSNRSAPATGAASSSRTVTLSPSPKVSLVRSPTSACCSSM
jgi:ABC-type sugar transport system substrate-binding protein